MKSLIPNSFKYPSLFLKALIIYFMLMFGLSLSGCQPRPIKSGTTWQGTYFPAPQVLKRLTLPEGVDCLRVDQEFQVSIEVHGDSKEMDIPVPMNVVFIIDQSGSMSGNDPNGLRIQAVENFLESLNQRAIEDYAAIIEYGSYAQGLYPATSVGMAPSLVKVTDHYLNMTSALATRNLNCTNIAQALELTNSALIDSGSDAKKIAILLTDGLPEKEFWIYDQLICEDDWDQLDMISDLSQEAFENGIRYYTIGLGSSVVEMILDDTIAQTTFGRYCPANTADDLGICFNEIWDSESERMTTQNIVVEERLVHGFKYKENSFDYSGGVSFADDALTTFSTNGQIDVQMGHLDENRAEFISFNVSCAECVEPVMPSESLSEDQLHQYLPVNISNAATNNARVRYHLGDGVDRHEALPAMEVCVERPGGPTIEKTFDDVNNIVTLRIKSNYLTSHPEHIIRDIHIKEILAPINFEPTSKMDIAGPLTDIGQIELIKMPFSIQPDSVEAFDNEQKWAFVYRWSIGDLSPQQQWEVKFPVRTGACVPAFDTPLTINFRKPISAMKMILPETQSYTEFIIPQAYTSNDYPLTDCPDPNGRIDFSLEPPLLENEIPQLKEETSAIWIDTDLNGFVEDWTNPDQIRSSIEYKLEIGSNRVTPVLSGDKLKFDAHTYVYVKYEQIGGSPTENTFIGIYAKPKYSELSWDQTKWIEINSKELTPDEAIATQPLFGPYEPAHFVRFKWVPTRAQLDSAVNTSPAPVTLTLESVKLRAYVASPGEVLINDNMADELIRSFQIIN